MKTLNIGGKEYKIEFTMEASLCNDCTEKVTGLMLKIAEADDKKAIKDMISTMSDIPQTSLTMFYAGLLEHHGPDGDGSVKSLKDAKALIKQYFNEHAEDGTGNFYDVLQILIEQMGEDGFFKQIGLEQMMNQTEEPKAKKEPKTPQDHKKKTTKATEK